MPDKHFDDYKIGQSWVSNGRTVTEADIVNFAGISADFFPLHIDKEYASRTPFGQRIAHGFLVMSMATGMVPADPEKVVALYGIDRLRFIKPVYVGDTIHIQMDVVEMQDRSADAGVGDFDFKVIYQHEDVVVVNLYRLLMRKRPAS